jgi:hypothetical protein
MTVITQKQQEAISSAGSRAFFAALRAAGLEGRAPSSLSDAEQGRVREAARAGLAAEAQMRESAGLIDLSGPGVPGVDGAAVGVPDPTGFLEPTNGELMDELRAAGVPLHRSFGERVTGGRGGFGRMRLSQPARAKLHALAVKADQARAATRVAAPDDDAGGPLLDLAGSGVVLADSDAQRAAERLAESKRGEGLRDGELLDLREASVTGLPTYGGAPDGKGGTLPEVEYDDGSAYQLLTELFAVISIENDDKGENLENAQIVAIADSVLSGHPLSSVQFGQLKVLAAKYADELAALRASDDDSQNYMSVPDPASGRLVSVARGTDAADAAAGRVAA